MATWFGMKSKERKSDPTWVQLVLARGIAISTIGTALVFLVGYCAPTYHVLVEAGTFSDVESYLGGAAAAAVGGGVIGCVVLWPWISAMASELNGAPFYDGDCVEILVGDYRGRRVLVYDVWDTRNQVRVDLGEQEEAKIADVFRYCEVYRVAGEQRSILEHRRNARITGRESK